MSQELDNNLFDLVKPKGVYSYEYVSDFERFKEQLWGKRKCYTSLTAKRITDKEYEHILKVSNKFEMKTIKDYHDLCLKWDVLLSAEVFWKI